MWWHAPLGRLGVTVFTPATDWEAEHVQMAVVHLFAAEIPQRATLARIMAAMRPFREA
jgi:hypothetical protein